MLPLAGGIGSAPHGQQTLHEVTTVAPLRVPVADLAMDGQCLCVELLG